MNVLRPYQVEAVESVLDHLSRHASTLLVLPTGTGKTVVAAKVIRQWPGTCLFLAHTTELVHQTADRLAHELGYRPPVEMGEDGQHEEEIGNGRVVVGSVQSMRKDRRLAKYQNHPFDLIIFDEAHRSTAASYRKIARFFRGINQSTKVLGMTATPKRSDRIALGTVFESVAYQLEINEAINDGWLVPVTQEYVVVETLNFDALPTTKNAFGEADFRDGALEEILTEEETLHRMVVPTIEKVGQRPTIVFTASVDHSHAVAAVLNRYRPGSAMAIDGGTDKNLRKQIVQDFLHGKLQFLCNCAVLIEGFDAPNCSAIVMGRPTKSVGLYTQMLGRGLRPLAGVVDGHVDADGRKAAIAGSLKNDCLVLDFVGNSEHKLAGVYDALGGIYDRQVIELAQSRSSSSNRRPDELIEQARTLLALERQWKEREHLRATARYSSHQVDIFGGGGTAVESTVVPHRGGATNGQIRMLVNLGVPQLEASAMSKLEASAAIDKLMMTRCTSKQARLLKRFGINPEGVSVPRASRIIDAIAANGWSRPDYIPE